LIFWHVTACGLIGMLPPAERPPSKVVAYISYMNYLCVN
jgi:hypothetical protein